jgi:signal transduction histidine kinase/predicted negative regulator of RcsB-dependent stress response
MQKPERKNNELQKEIDKMNEDALKASNSDVHLAKELLDKANSLAKEISYKKGLARNLYIYGYFYLRTSKYDEAAAATDEAFSIYENLHDRRGVGHCYNNYGGVYLYKSDFKKSLEYYQKALSVSEELKDNRAESIAANNIGNIYLQLGEYYKALEYYIKSLNIKIELKDENGIGNTHSNIGTVHIRLANYNIAIENYKKALDLSERTKDKYVEGNVLMNLGVAHSKMGDHEKALEYYKKGLGIRQEMEDKHGMALVLNNIGVSINATKGYNEAIKYFRKCLKIQKELNYPYGISETLSEMAELFCDNGKHDLALEYFEKSKKIAEECDFKTQLEACLYGLSTLYFRLNNFEMAYKYLNEHLKIKEELLLDNSEARVRNLQIVYETENERTLSEFYRQKSIELTKLNDRLEEINKQKNEFMGIASHDLRDPISSIHSIAEIIREENIKLNASEIIEYSDGIIKLSDKLLGLLKNLLNVNRIESGNYNFKFESVNLYDTIQEIVRMYSAHAEEKNISIEVDVANKGMKVKADRYSLEQILSNLISNGIKFTYPGKKVFVKAADKEDKVILEIADEGQGVKPGEVGKLFDKFAKISSKPTGGELSTGLGLSIVKRLIEIMKGNISVVSEIGKGTKFTIELNKP